MRCRYILLLFGLGAAMATLLIGAHLVAAWGQSPSALIAASTMVQRLRVEPKTVPGRLADTVQLQMIGPPRTPRLSNPQLVRPQEVVDERYVAAARARIRTQMLKNALAMMADLGITREQATALIDLQTDIRMSSLNSSSILIIAQSSATADVAPASSAPREETARIDERIVDILGTDKAREYHEYLAMAPARQQVDRLQASLELEGIPLTEDQVKPLVTALGDAQASWTRALDQLKSDATAAESSAKLDGAYEARERMLAATRWLSPEQLAVLEKLLADQARSARTYGRTGRGI